MQIDQQEDRDRKRGSETSAFPLRQRENKAVVCSKLLYTDLPALDTRPRGHGHEHFLEPSRSHMQAATLQVSMQERKVCEFHEL